MSIAAIESPILPGSLHPDAERLAMHASGQLRPIERVVLESHLAFCGACSERLRELLVPGTRWLGSVASEHVPASWWESLERRLDSPAPAPTALAALPRAGWEELDPKPALRWEKIPTSGARFTRLGSDPELDADLVLVGLQGGERFPTHVHLGHEEVVILSGGFTDRYGHLDAGDYHRYPPGSEHGPEIDAGEQCWTLGLIERGLRFRGLLGVIQWLGDPRARRARRRVKRPRPGHG